MSSTDSREKAIDAFGPILIKNGYDWVELDKFAVSSEIEPSDLKSQFSNKALLCEAWMDETDAKARNHHNDLLSSGMESRKVLEKYFTELEEFMKEHHFAGCPFTNTAKSAQGRSEAGIQTKVQAHKTEVRSFFRKLCEKGSFQPKMLSEAFFLMYSGATTESSNMNSLEPVHAGRQAALSLFDLHAV